MKRSKFIKKITASVLVIFTLLTMLVFPSSAAEEIFAIGEKNIPHFRRRSIPFSQVRR